MKLIDVVMSTCAGAGGYGRSIYISARHDMVMSWPFSKAEDVSHSADEATMILTIFHSTRTDPLSFGWTLSTSLWNLRETMTAYSDLCSILCWHVPSLRSHSTMSGAAHVIVPFVKVIIQSRRLFIESLVPYVDFDCCDDAEISTTNGICFVDVRKYARMS